jgi:hypothetical protein
MRFALAALLALFVSPALAQDVTLKQSDLMELNRILQEQVPPKWSAPVIAWANAIMQRQAEEKVVGPEKPKAEVKPEAPKK